MSNDPRFRHDEEDEDDAHLDADDHANMQLESSGVQKALLPLYVIIFAFWLSVAVVPPLILYTIVHVTIRAMQDTRPPE